MQRSLEDTPLANSYQCIQQLQQQVAELQKHLETLRSQQVTVGEISGHVRLIQEGLNHLERNLFQSAINVIPGRSQAVRPVLPGRPLHHGKQWSPDVASQVLQAPDPELIIRITGSGVYLDFKPKRNFVPVVPVPMTPETTLHDLLPTPLADQYLAHIQRALQTGDAQVFEFQLEKQNVVAYEEAYIVPIQADEVLMVVRDISDRKRVEQQLLQSEATNRALLETVPDLLIRLSRTGTYLDFKPSKNSKVLHTPETAIGKNIYELLPFDVAQDIMTKVEAAFQTSVVQNYECQLLIDGELHYQEARVSPVSSHEVLVIVRDINYRKQSELALSQANERYRLATTAVNSTIYDWDVARNYIDRSQGVSTQLGFTPDECEPTSEWWNERIHPEDAPRAVQIMTTALQTANRFSLEYRIRNRQDQYVYVHDQAMILRNGTGQVVRVVGNTVDITARKQAEAALLQSEATNRALVEAIPDLMIRMTKIGTCLDFRYPPGFQVLFTPEAAIGRNFADLLPAHLAQERLRLAQQALQTGEVQLHEMQLQIDGKTVFQEARISAINDDEVLILVRDISDRKEAEEALRQSQANSLALIENTEDFIWSVDQEYRLVSLNSAFGKCFQKTFDQILTPGCEILAYLPPAGKQYWQSLYDRALLGERFITEFEVSTSQGRYLEVACNPIRAHESQQIVGVSVFSRDITIYKKAQAVLETAKSELELKVQERTIALQQTIDQLSQEIQERHRMETQLKLRDRAIAASNNGIVICDASQPDLPIIYANLAFEKITGYTQSEIIGHNCRCLQSTNTAQSELQTLRAAIRAGQPCTVTLQNYRKDGTLFWNELSIAPIYDVDHVLTHFVGIQTDITDLKQSEVDIRQALVKEQELGELKSRFISMTSHEFRTPLTVIMSSAALLENYSQRWTEEKKLTHLQRIQIAGRRMTQLLDDILVLSKAEADKLLYQPAPLHVPQFCQTLVTDLLLSDNDQHQIHFAWTGQQPVACLDEKMLQQVLTNLLSNSIKYSPIGTEVQFSVSEEVGTWVFQIQDQGIGIPLSDVPHIFDSFHRGRNVGTISGTGLGLTIVKKWVDLQGGTIAVTSHEGEGTLFVVKLPVGVSPANCHEDPCH